MWSSIFFVFFFKQKTAYELRIRDWGSDVCSSDRGGDGRLRDNFRTEPARTDRLDADLGGLDRISCDDETVGERFARRFLTAFGGRRRRRIGCPTRDTEAGDSCERHGTRDGAEETLVLGDHILSPDTEATRAKTGLARLLAGKGKIGLEARPTGRVRRVMAGDPRRRRRPRALQAPPGPRRGPAALRSVRPA